MSLGAYGCLCNKDATDVREADLEAMANTLAELGAVDAAKDTFDLLAVVRTQRARIDAAMHRLYGVFYAVELAADDDSPRLGAEVDKALAKYRGEEGAA